MVFPNLYEPNENILMKKSILYQESWNCVGRQLKMHTGIVICFNCITINRGDFEQRWLWKVWGDFEQFLVQLIGHRPMVQCYMILEIMNLITQTNHIALDHWSLPYQLHKKVFKVTPNCSKSPRFTVLSSYSWPIALYYSSRCTFNTSDSLF